MINVILADDHMIVRYGLRIMLSETPDIHVSGEASDGNEVLALLEAGTPADVIVADIMMPDMNGIELARQINCNHPNLSVLILTVKEGDEYLQNSFKACVQGYLLKTAEKDEITFAIRQAVRRKPYICSDLAARLMVYISNMPLNSGTQRRSDIKFSEREMEVLTLIAEGLTNQEAADKLFSIKRTIEGHRQALMNKTGTKNAAQLIRFAMREGILE